MPTRPQPLYDNPPFRGVIFAGNTGNGSIITIQWLRAFTDQATSFDIAYNIYYSTRQEDVLAEGIKAVVINATQLSGDVIGLTPGKTYYFLVRASLQDTNRTIMTGLPVDADNCRTYTEASLLSDITATDLIIPVSDINTFPVFGIVQIGTELITYTSLDLDGGNLLVSERGTFASTPRLHRTDGYDGVSFKDPLVRHFKGFEDDNITIISEEIRFDENNFARTNADGYREKTSLVTTDLSITDAENAEFPSYDFAGWRRTDPVNLLAGDCVGSYWGGEHFCADGYNGIGRQVRGIPLQDHNTQREEVLLSVTGEPVVLVRRQYSGIQNPAVTSTKESPEHRFPGGFGTEGITGYEQFFNSRRSDGRIMIRFDPTKEDIQQQDPGRENIFIPGCWTLVTPGIQDRDFFIRFNQDGTEEFRYEILDVTRNKTVLGESGRQVFTARRLRKTEPQYQFRTFRNTATMPVELGTSISSTPGPGGILPHVHTIVINENTLVLTQINQTTSYSRSHSHTIINGVVQESAGHSHLIVLP